MTRNPDVMKLLAASRLPGLDPVSDPAARRRLLLAAMAHPVKPAGRRHQWTRSSLHPIIRLGAVAAVAIAALVLQTTTGVHRTQTQPQGTQTTTSAQAILLAAARRTETTPVTTQQRYWHTSVLWGTNDGHAQQDRWVAASMSDVSWVTDWTEAGLKPQPRQYDSRQAIFDLEGRALTISDLQQLPGDADALREFLLAPYPASYQKNDPVGLNQRLFGQAAALTRAPVKPSVRAAAFRLMAELPGVRPLGHVRDALGRSGVGVAVSETIQPQPLPSYQPPGSGPDQPTVRWFGGYIPGTVVEHQLIIDPSAGSVLATQDVIVKAAASHNGYMPGHVEYFAILQSGWTDAVISPQAFR